MDGGGKHGDLHQVGAVGRVPLIALRVNAIVNTKGPLGQRRRRLGGHDHGQRRGRRGQQGQAGQLRAHPRMGLGVVQPRRGDGAMARRLRKRRRGGACRKTPPARRTRLPRRRPAPGASPLCRPAARRVGHCRERSASMSVPVQPTKREGVVWPQVTPLLEATTDAVLYCTFQTRTAARFQCLVPRF